MTMTAPGTYAARIFNIRNNVALFEKLLAAHESNVGDDADWGDVGDIAEVDTFVAKALATLMGDVELASDGAINATEDEFCEFCWSGLPTDCAECPTCGTPAE